MGGKTSKAAQEKYRSKPGYADIQRNAFLKRTYGITLEQWSEKFAAQDSKCAICFSEDPKLKWWCTDHDHRTGKLRSIICHHCNNILGFARDNPETLLDAFHYLCKHSENSEQYLLDQPYKEQDDSTQRTNSQ